MTSKLGKPQARSLIAIDRELDLAAINAKRNKKTRCPSRSVDLKPHKEHLRRVQILELENCQSALGTTPAPQRHSILKNNMKCPSNVVPSAVRSPNLTAMNSDCVRSANTTVEQQATNFIDELFGRWTQHIKAAMPFEDFTLSQVLSGRNSSSSLL